MFYQLLSVLHCRARSHLSGSPQVSGGDTWRIIAPQKINAQVDLWKIINGWYVCYKWTLILIILMHISSLSSYLQINIWMFFLSSQGFPSGSASKEFTCSEETLVPPLGREDPLEKGMATHSRILAWRIPWAEEPDGLQSTGSQKSQTRLRC